jgi:hypothetical protein
MFRRSGSFTAFYVDGKIPEPGSEAFVEALRNHRFRTIENAASEEASVGWVTAGDPTGDTFEAEHMDLDRAMWLRVRFDKKKLPPIWVQIHRNEAERSAGRKLSAKERKDLKEDLQSKLLPRILPSVALVDVLYEPRGGLLLLFGTSKAVREDFVKLFFRTFAVNLVVADAYESAARAGLGRDAQAYLEEVAPVRWLRDGAPVAGPRPGLGRDAPEPDETERDAEDRSAAGHEVHA